MKSKQLIIAGLTLAAGLWGSGVAQAVDFPVTNAQEFQTALTTTSNNGTDDIIILNEGRYKGSFSQVALETNSLTIRIAAGLTVGQVVLDGDNTTRVLSLTSDLNTSFILENLFIINGKADDGAGVYIRTGVATGSKVGADVSISGCVIRNNVFSSDGSYINSYGGGVYIGPANDIILSGNTISDNSRIYNYSMGGGVYISTANSATIANNNILNNSSGSYGGIGIASVTTVSLTGNAIKNNVGSTGGFYIYNATSATLTENEIIGNSSAGGAGGGYIGLVNSIALLSNTISGNSAGGSVAGIYIANRVPYTYRDNSDITLTGNKITGNNAGDYGGVYIYTENRPATILVANNLIENNIASGTCYANLTCGQYGGVYVYSHNVASDLVLTENTITGNTANGHHAGVYADSGILKFVNNVITQNKSLYGLTGGVYVNALTSILLTNNTISGNEANAVADSVGGVRFVRAAGVGIQAYNNIIWGNKAGTSDCADVYLLDSFTGASEELFNNDIDKRCGITWDVGGGNINVDPLFAGQTTGDYHLSGTSGAINSGKNDAVGIPAIDKDADPRIANITVDMGAYEQSNTSFHPADIDSNWNISQIEFDNYAAAWKNGTSWGTPLKVIAIDYVTRAGFLVVNGGNYHNTGGGKPTGWVAGP